MIRPLLKDRTFWAVIIILLSLAILGWLQFTLIRQNLIISREQLDQEVAQTLALTHDEMAVRTPLSNLLAGAVRKDTVSFPVGLDSLTSAATGFYKMFLTDRFQRAGISADFEFALLDALSDSTYLRTDGFEFGYQASGNYKIPMTGYIKYDCGCAPYLNLKISNYRSYVMRGIWWTLIPGLFCILLMGFGFFLLIRLVREQHYLNAMKNDFINHLTHEIKTPLFATRLSLKLLEEKTGPEVHGIINAAREKNDIVAANVEKILELASLESPGQVLELRKIDLSEIVPAVIRTMNSDGERIHLERMDPGASVLGDEYHIRNSLMNLIDNAFKYSKPGTPVNIRCEIEGDRVLLSVSDQGIGIEGDDTERIFMKFYRADNTSVSGFGLGLSYVRQVIRMMGGEVSVLSTPGKGSVFSIDLPVTR